MTSRIDRLVDSGVIRGFTLRLSNDVDRDAVRGVTVVVTTPNEGQSLIREIRGYPEIERLHSTTGSWDLVVQLRCCSLSEFDLVAHTRALKGLLRPAQRRGVGPRGVVSLPGGDHSRSRIEVVTALHFAMSPTTVGGRGLDRRRTRWTNTTS